LVCKYRNFFLCSKTFYKLFFKILAPDHRRQGVFRREVTYLQCHADQNDGSYE